VERKITKIVGIFLSAEHIASLPTAGVVRIEGTDRILVGVATSFAEIVEGLAPWIGGIGGQPQCLDGSEP
jgi:hypothetical protein